MALIEHQQDFEQQQFKKWAVKGGSRNDSCFPIENEGHFCEPFSRFLPAKLFCLACWMAMPKTGYTHTFNFDTHSERQPRNIWLEPKISYNKTLKFTFKTELTKFLLGCQRMNHLSSCRLSTSSNHTTRLPCTAYCQRSVDPVARFGLTHTLKTTKQLLGRLTFRKSQPSYRKPKASHELLLHYHYLIMS